MEDSVMAEANRAAKAAEYAANRASTEARPAKPDGAGMDAEKTYPPPTIIAPMPWAVMQHRITTLIASIHLPEDTHPDRVKAILLVDLVETQEGDWDAEGIFDEGWKYSISVSERGAEEFGAGYNIYIYLMAPKIDDAPVSVAGSMLCTWSMDEFTKIIVQNGYEKGIEQRLAKEVWEFYDTVENPTYNRYLETFVYRMKDGSERGAPCLSRIHISTGYKEQES